MLLFSLAFLQDKTPTTVYAVSIILGYRPFIYVDMEALATENCQNSIVMPSLHTWVDAMLYAKAIVVIAFTLDLLWSLALRLSVRALVFACLLLLFAFFSRRDTSITRIG